MYPRSFARLPGARLGTRTAISNISRKWAARRLVQLATTSRATIASETHEYTDIYPGMARVARKEGFDEIADWFVTLAKAGK